MSAATIERQAAQWWEWIPPEDRPLWAALAGSSDPVLAYLAYRLIDGGEEKARQQAERAGPLP